MKLRHAVALTLLLIADLCFRVQPDAGNGPNASATGRNFCERGNTDIGLHLAAGQACQVQSTV